MYSFKTNFYEVMQMDYWLKQALKVLVTLACGVGVTAASISINDKNSETVLTNERFEQWWTTYPTDKILKTPLEKGKNATEYIE